MKKGKKNVKKGKKCRHPASTQYFTQYFEVGRRFHVKFSFFEFGFCYDVVSHIKTITSKIYRQLTSTQPFFLRRSPRCFRVRPAEALHTVEEFSQLRQRLNARRGDEPQLRHRFNMLMTTILDVSRADFPLVASTRGGCLAALEFE